MQEGNTYRIVLGCETSTGQIVMTGISFSLYTFSKLTSEIYQGENQGEAENSQWLGTFILII